MGRTLAIETAPVFEPLLKPSRYKGAYGGRGGAKSYFFADLLLERCMLQKGTRAVCVREIQKSLDDSVKQLLEDKIQRFELDREFRVLNTHIEGPGDGMIIFQGMQQHTAEQIKSLEGYDVAWVEEAQSLSQRSLDVLRPTLRKAGSEIWFSWNPRFPTDPVDAFLRKDPPKDAIVVKSTYRDNPWFPQQLAPEIAWDQSHDPEKYAHIWLGEYETRSEARVFKNWKIEAFDTPSNATFYFGADWGFSEDPTVLVRAYITDRTLFIDREAYQLHCEIDKTAALFDGLACEPMCQGLACKHPHHGMARRWIILADSARPETISYLQRFGYPRLQKARKGPGSVEEGITFLQNYQIVVHPRCRHTIDELSSYSYQTDKLTGNVLPVLEDKKNHVIDALRYSVETLRAVKPSVGVVKAPDNRWQRQFYR